MSDDIDRANETAQFNNDLALHHHRSEHKQPLQVWVYGSVVCMDCDLAIPSERLLAVPDCVRCVDCQTLHEIRERQ